MRFVLISGSREFIDMDRAFDELDKIVEFIKLESETDEVTIVTSGSKGAEYVGRQYANQYDYELLELKPEWDIHGKSAGYINHRRLVNKASDVIILKTGPCKITDNLVSLARSKDINVYIVPVRKA